MSLQDMALGEVAGGGSRELPAAPEKPEPPFVGSHLTMSHKSLNGIVLWPLIQMAADRYRGGFPQWLAPVPTMAGRNSTLSVKSSADPTLATIGRRKW